MWIRAARPTADEARAATALILASKAHWGYDTAFLDACREELTVTPADVRRRRIVVAETADGVLAGVASLDGGPPTGEIGLLFVAPELIGTGVGRALYAHLVEEAGALGCTGLTVAADPHAVGFYRSLGARPVPGAAAGPLPVLAVEVPRRPGWARAWTSGRRAVHLGNVAEFQSQFRPDTGPDAGSRRSRGVSGPGRRFRTPVPVPDRAADHYACLAAFTGLHPAAVVLPARVPAGWAGLVSRQLRWSCPEVYDGLDEAALLGQGGLGERWRNTPVVVWGQTPATAVLTGTRLGPDALRYESKRASYALFTRLAREHPGIRLPERWTPANRRAAAGLIAARARTGAGTVVKTEHGAGGSGTRILTARVAARSLPRGPLLLEEYLPGGTDPSYDGFVDASGTVHDVGVAAMDIDGTAYRGATVGPGAVSDTTAERALAFGNAVGRRLAEAGYRGWFDVDYVAGPGGLLAPVETNLRLTGPSVAFIIRQRLAENRGPAAARFVRTLDRVPLGARLPDAELLGFLERLTARCATIGTVVVPVIPSAAHDPVPFLGLAVAAPSPDHLAAVDALVHAECRSLDRLLG
ncbi:GNAT family N-acetyltransferase [Streptomyces qinzhouensis]|uniref:GNAT family N-acetyltransferase n=1 Tax=Streptomyces qinzhouensis TaxID=2599401 RepID=A0A5B8JHG3_9ACTN|nr:GNAT family N-acetyltransferase [Streptomyces qinzhouensis]QDY79774.1 GNAT family N-acetyltransferase [Streptomyces qinzhouensis]